MVLLVVAVMPSCTPTTLLVDNLHTLLLAPIRFRVQTDERVGVYRQERELLDGQVEEVGVQAAQHSQVSDNEQRLLLALQLEDHRVQASNHVKVALAAGVAVSQLILHTRTVLLRKPNLDLVVRHTVTDTGFNFSKRSPFHVLVLLNSSSSFARRAHCGRPHVDSPAVQQPEVIKVVFEAWGGGCGGGGGVSGCALWPRLRGCGSARGGVQQTREARVVVLQKVAQSFCEFNAAGGQLRVTTNEPTLDELSLPGAGHVDGSVGGMQSRQIHHKRRNLGAQETIDHMQVQGLARVVSADVAALVVAQGLILLLVKVHAQIEVVLVHVVGGVVIIASSVFHPFIV
mmetsp:Transcript_7698/g.12985  ORF Transcript_7698/g.12985 Transcript_7698/m.12985 type:complete len:343 (-) Transcript_7698:926-1954(-)